MYEGCWLTFDLQVGRTFGVGGDVRHLACHGHFAVVQDQRVFAALLDDVNILSYHIIKSHSFRTQESLCLFNK